MLTTRRRIYFLNKSNILGAWGTTSGEISKIGDPPLIFVVICNVFWHGGCIGPRALGAKWLTKIAVMLARGANSTDENSSLHGL